MLTLVTGPANSAKAAELFERLRAMLDSKALLVVPTQQDVQHYALELEDHDLIFTETITFAGLLREIAETVGTQTPVQSPIACRLQVAGLCRQSRFEMLGHIGVNEVVGLFKQLQQYRVTAERYRAAVKSAATTHAEREQLLVITELFAEFEHRLNKQGVCTREQYNWSVLDALRQQPITWNRPVFFYGFDDLTPVEKDAVETLALHTDTEVWLTLPYEAGRYAFAGTARLVEDLRPIARHHMVISPSADYYSVTSRNALHTLERSIFEPKGERRPEGNEGVVLLESASAQAELELIAQTVAQLVSDGIAADDIAVVARSSVDRQRFAEAINGFGLPISLLTEHRLVATSLGAVVIAYGRVATGLGDAHDLVTWMRAAGQPAQLIDELERRVIRAGSDSITYALRILSELEVAEPSFPTFGDDNPAAFVTVLANEAKEILSRPYIGGAEQLSKQAIAGIDVIAALYETADALEFFGGSGDQITARELMAALADIELATRANRSGVTVAGPTEIRARRYRAVVVSGLQEGKFPRVDQQNSFMPPAIKSYLAIDDEDKQRERYLFYACISRPTDRLILSWRTSEDGERPIGRSPYIDSVIALFDQIFEFHGKEIPELNWPQHGGKQIAVRRGQGSPALDPRTLDRQLADVVSKRRFSARELETAARCGMRWLVEHVLKPKPIYPDSEQLEVGSLAHNLLERVIVALRAETGSGVIGDQSIDCALKLLDASSAELLQRTKPGPKSLRIERIAREVRQYLIWESEYGSGWEPQRLEWSFGLNDVPPLTLDEIEITGRIDRIDVSAGSKALLRDYKRRMAPSGLAWEDDAVLQMPLYMRAVQRLTGQSVVGGVFQPLTGSDLRPRGVVDESVSGSFVSNDVLEPDEIETILVNAEEAATATAKLIQSGAIKPCPERCAGGRCAYPSICNGRTISVIETTRSEVEQISLDLGVMLD